MRVAVYFVPHSCPPLMKTASRWLGKREHSIASISITEIDKLLQAPNHYGFHATIKPPFRLNNGYALNDVEKELAVFVKEIQPFLLPPLELARINNFFCLRLKNDSEAVHNVTGGVKMQKSGGFKMLFCGGEYSAAPDVFSRCGRLVFSASLDLYLLFHAVAFAFYNDGVGVMQKPVEDGGRKRRVIVKNLRPVFVCPV